MKVISAEKMKNEEYREFALNEASYLKEEININIIKVHDFFKSDSDGFCIVMDYADGYSLQDLVE